MATSPSAPLRNNYARYTKEWLASVRDTPSEPPADSPTLDAVASASTRAFDALLEAQRLVEASSNSPSPSSSPEEPPCTRPLDAMAVLASVCPPLAVSPLTVRIDGQMAAVLRQYALQRSQLLRAAPPPPAPAPAAAPAPAKRSAPEWMAKSWASHKRAKYSEGAGKGMQWQPRYDRVDANGVPLRPFGVHMVCLAASETKEGGCGCRMSGEPRMEHNGVGGVGEWHVVTQPHFNCAKGSFRPAVFVTACEAACECKCHVAGAGVDPADCGCKGAWRRVGAEVWVKTTTAPTANSWKDRRLCKANNVKTTASAPPARAFWGRASALA
ncbi:hypothetical protein AB1Y20_005086 [Prymnesium parvum]|uniref:Uncharacterized protein n=1 Tax=Prymnesium parvum TaxID=97485 RepID=A0AB34J4V4_PRYPA